MHAGCGDLASGQYREGGVGNEEGNVPDILGQQIVLGAEPEVPMQGLSRQEGGERMMEMTVSFRVSGEQATRLERLLEVWQGKPGVDGNYPFKDWTLQDMFRTVMEVGSTHTINRCLDIMESINEIKTVETPAAGTAGGSG